MTDLHGMRCTLPHPVPTRDLSGLLPLFIEGMVGTFMALTTEFCLPQFQIVWHQHILRIIYVGIIVLTCRSVARFTLDIAVEGGIRAGQASYGIPSTRWF